MIKTLYRTLPLDTRLRLRKTFGNVTARFVRDLVSIAHAHGAAKPDYYLEAYKRFLPAKPSLLLEIGIGGYDNPVAGGNSLRMWRSYFPDAEIWGIDIADKSPHDARRIKTFQGSQVDEEFLRSVVTRSPDVIIDDGSHVPGHVVQTFNILFPLLKSGGLYVVEDTETSYWGGENAVDYFKELVHCPNHSERKDDYSPNDFDLNIHSLHFCHNMVLVQKTAV